METSRQLITVDQGTQLYLTLEQLNLIDDIRNIWSDLRIWTRLYITSAVSGFGNLDAIRKKLYQIPLEFKEKIQTFYGQEFAEEIVQFLTKQIGLLEQITLALKQDDQKTVDSAITEMYKDADTLSASLEKVNPYWSYPIWRNLFFQYINLMIDQLITLLSGEYEKDLDIYDRLTFVSRKMGRYMAEGILQGLNPQK